MIRIRHSGNQPIEDTAYGNIISYCDAAGNIVASYTYDAFGQTISQSGALADVFAFRYSTKYFDCEAGFYYNKDPN